MEKELEALIVQNEKSNKNTEKLLETIIAQNEKNNPEKILESNVVLQEKTVASIDQVNKNLESLIEEVKKKEDFEIDPEEIRGEKGDKGDNYILTEEDKLNIARSIEVPVVEKIIEKVETIKEVSLKDTPKEIKSKLLEEGLSYTEIIDAPDIKDFKSDLDFFRTKLSRISSKTYDLKEMADVSIPDPQNNQVLKYNSNTGKWEAQTDSSGVTEFIQLTDVPNSYTGASLQGVRVNAGETGLEFYTTVDTDEKVKISATDTTAGYLDDKLSVTGSIIKSITNPGGNEVINLDVDLTGYVPYIGATGDVDLGAHSIKAGLGASGYAGHFSDGTNSTILADGTYAINSTGNSVFNITGVGDVNIGGSALLEAKDFTSQQLGALLYTNGMGGSYAGYFVDNYTAPSSFVKIIDPAGPYALNVLGRSYFEVGGTDHAIEAYQNNNAGGAAGYFHSVAGSAYLGDVTSGYAVKAVGNVEISGSIYNTAGSQISIDPNARILYAPDGITKALDWDNGWTPGWIEVGGGIAADPTLAATVSLINLVTGDLQNYNGATDTALNWQNRILIDGSGATGLDWSNASAIKLTQYNTDGFVKTSAGDGTIILDTNSYVIDNVGSASKLLGRGDSGAGVVEEITLGTGLLMTGTTLSVTGGTGDVVGPASAVNNNVVFFDGITGKLIKDSGLTLSGSNTGDQTITLTGDVTGSGTGSFAATIANDAVTYAKIQNVSAASKLLGRGDSGSGDVEEITLGSGLTMTGTTLSASGSVTPAALTKADDTNVTLTLGGTPATALLQATSITVGWTGTLAYSRFVNGAGLSVVGRSANSAGVQADIVGTNNTVLRVSGSVLGFGAIDISTAQITGDLPFANLTQGSARSVLGVTGNATADVASIQGTANQVLRVDSAGTGLAFGQLNLASASAVTGFLPIGNIVSTAGSPATQFLRGDGTWQVPAGGSLTGSGAANQLTYWTSATNISGDTGFTLSTTLGKGLTITQTASTGAVVSALTVTGAAHTAITASTEKNWFYHNETFTHQWATGALANQRTNRFAAETLSFVGASVVTEASTAYISSAVRSGTNSTITASYGLQIDTVTVANGGAVTSATGLLVKAPTGATSNGAAQFRGGPVSIGLTGVEPNYRLSIYNDGTTTQGMLFIQGGLSQTGNMIQVSPFSTGTFTINSNARLTTQGKALTGTPRPQLWVIAAADTNLTASTEDTQALFSLNQSKQWNTGALALQRDFSILAATYTTVAASTFTTCATFAVSSGPIKGTNCAITNSIAIYSPGAAVSTASNSYGLHITASTGATQNYAGYFSGRVGFNNTAPTYSVDITAMNSSTGGLKVRGAASQALPLFLIETSTPTTVFQIDQIGMARIQPIAGAGSVGAELLITVPAHTSLTASTETHSVYINNASTCQWATGALTTQRDVRINRPTYSFVGASTITDAATLSIDGHPTIGTNATITNAYALWVQGASGNGTNAYGLRVDNPTGSNTINRALLIQSSLTNGTPAFRFSGASSGTARVTQDTVHEDVQTTDATVSNILSVATASSNNYTIRAFVTAIQTAGSGTVGHGAGYEVVATFRNIAGALTQIGTTTTLYTHEDNAGWNCGIVVSGTNIIVQVTGEASKTIRWHCIAEYETVAS